MARKTKTKATTGHLILQVDPLDDFAMLSLLRFMTWPRDKRRRDHALATWSAQMLARKDTFAPMILQGGLALAMNLAMEGGPDFSPQRIAARAAEMGLTDRLGPSSESLAAGIAQRITDEAYEPAGGLASVAEAPGAEVLYADLARAMTRGAYVSGVVLLSAASLRIHSPDSPVSTNRAIGLVDVLKSRGMLPKTAPTGRSFWNFWPEWRGVAPLWAALILAANPQTAWSVPESLHARAGLAMADLLGLQPALRNMQTLSTDPSRRLMMCAWAVWLRNLAAKLHAPNSLQPLIAANETFRFVPDITPIQPPVGRFAPE